jgi:hypothetical protein
MEASDAGAFRNTQRAVLLGCAGAVTLAAWLWLAAGSQIAFMPAHRHHQLDFRAFASLVLMWQAMMVDPDVRGAGGSQRWSAARIRVGGRLCRRLLRGLAGV